jgi:plastocyanin
MLFTGLLLAASVLSVSILLVFMPGNKGAAAYADSLQHSNQEADGKNSIRGRINLLDLNGKLKNQRSNVAIFIDDIQVDPSTATKAENPAVSQRGRRFRPGTMTVLKGTKVDFMNDDRVLHNVFSLSTTQPFDLGNYERGTSRSVTFDNPGLVKVYCNLHSNMVLNVLVLENPIATTTNADGDFVLENIPDGSYTLRVWQEFSDEKSIDVSVSGNQTLELDIELQESKTFIQHNNKYGKPYRGKY